MFEFENFANGTKALMEAVVSLTAAGGCTIIGKQLLHPGVYICKLCIFSSKKMFLFVKAFYTANDSMCSFFFFPFSFFFIFRALARELAKQLRKFEKEL